MCKYLFCLLYHKMFANQIEQSRNSWKIMHLILPCLLSSISPCVFSFFFAFYTQFLGERSLEIAPFGYAWNTVFILAISTFMVAISSVSFCSHSSMLDAYTFQITLLPLIFGEYIPSYTFLLTWWIEPVPCCLYLLLRGSNFSRGDFCGLLSGVGSAMPWEPSFSLFTPNIAPNLGI